MSGLIIHRQEFLKAIQKCSVNSVFEQFQMTISKDKVKSGTTNANQSLVSILSFENNFISGMSDSEIFEINFIQPNSNIIPQLRLFSDNELSCKMTFSKGNTVSKIKATETSSKTVANWPMGIPNPTLIFSNSSKLKAFTPFIEINLTEEILKSCDLVRKASVTNTKIYFTTLKDSIRLEATDWKNDFSSNFNKTLQEDLKLEQQYQHIVLCFDMVMFFSVLKQLDVEKKFICKLIYKPEKKIGACLLTSEDNSEFYFMPTVIEEYNQEKVLKKLKEDD